MLILTFIGSLVLMILPYFLGEDCRVILFDDFTIFLGTEGVLHSINEAPRLVKGNCEDQFQEVSLVHGVRPPIRQRHSLATFPSYIGLPPLFLCL
jgi:hypothetical protein